MNERSLCSKRCSQHGKQVAAALGLDDHLHCDGVVLLPEHWGRKTDEPPTYAAAWSRGLDLHIEVRRLPGKRGKPGWWRASLRQHGELDHLLDVYGLAPQDAVAGLETAIQTLRAAFGRKNRPL